jgi:predicted glycogen debranching enzyme
MTLRLSDATVRTLDEATRREWLVTNGIGGFAAGTVSGIATRRYHGLLVAALHPPRGRHVLITSLDATLVEDGEAHAMASHAFHGVVHPDGWRTLTGFALDPLPTWSHAVANRVIERSVFMVQGENTTVLRYTLHRGAPALLRLQPFAAFRDFHHHTHENPDAHIAAQLTPQRSDEIALTPYEGWVTVKIRTPGTFRHAPDWWRNFEHGIEAERGLDAHEDLFTPGFFEVHLSPEVPTYVVITAAQTVIDDPARAEAREVARLRALAPGNEPDADIRTLHVAVDAYRAHLATPPALLAGYPWFEDWGRDTLIAFVGAYLVPGRCDEGRDILAAFARYIDRGMLPNRFPDGAAGHADYNTVDAPVWFFHAARRYVHYTRDVHFACNVLRPALAAIERALREGTRYDIKVGDDGLLYAGSPQTQLTWMDARVGDTVFTARDGAPVEVNALWHTALLTLADFANLAGDAREATRLRTEAARTRDSFRARFWNATSQRLYDVVRRDGHGDPAVRPNALLAVALPGALLSPDEGDAVIDLARRELLVPGALRTLSPRDLHYRGRYGGDPWSRDSAYHQGTAWPFLLGWYTAALARNASRRGTEAALGAAHREIAHCFEGLSERLKAQGIGHLAEIVEGDAPHRAVGCFAQAWSDAEALRALYEDRDRRGPEDVVTEGL